MIKKSASKLLPLATNTILGKPPKQSKFKTLRKFEQVIGKLSGAFGWLAGWFCILMIAIVFVDVVARYGFDAGSIAMQEMEWHLFAAVFLLGAAYTMRENANVRVDVFYAKMSARKKAMVDIFGTVVFVIPMCSLILYSSYDFVAYSYQIQEISSDPGGLPYRFAFRALLPLGYFLVMLQSLAVISRNVRVLAGDIENGLTNHPPTHQEKL